VHSGSKATALGARGVYGPSAQAASRTELAYEVDLAMVRCHVTYWRGAIFKWSRAATIVRMTDVLFAYFLLLNYLLQGICSKSFCHSAAAFQRSLREKLAVF